MPLVFPIRRLRSTDFTSNMGYSTGLVVDKIVTAFRRGRNSAMEWRKPCRSQDSVMSQLRHLDTDASWSKSGYHGWVYGYGLHLVDNRVGFPKWVQVETAAVAESEVIDHQAAHLMQHFRPGTVTTDNSYAKARRIRQWAKHGIVLLSPAVKWVKGRYATAYHRYIQQPENAELLQSHRTAIEPVFDLIAHSLGIRAMQKQLPIQKLSNVRTCLPLRNISTMAAAFSWAASPAWRRRSS
jgi:hypothetical protein